MDNGRERVVSAGAMAALLGDQRGAEILASLRALRWTNPDGSPQSEVPPRAGPRRIGVWDIVETDAGAALQRCTDLPGETSVLWADIDHVPGQGSAKRVVLVGESMARGYLIDPIFTGTLALQRALAAVAPGESFQCVDLARTSIDVFELQELVATLPAIKPDVVVCIAGNNWSISCYEQDNMYGLAEAFRVGGYRAMREEFVSTVVLPEAYALLAGLLALREEHGIEPVLVIPEFNLLGWTPLGEADVIEVPVLPGDAIRDWYSLREQALNALRDERWEQARALGAAMRELDRGLSPLPGYVMGLALAAMREPDMARAEFEQSRDSVYGLVIKYLPRTPRRVQDLILQFCRSHQLPCVDLQGVLGRTDVPQLPDPMFFLDYCHLSDRGLQRAMTAVAERITGSPAAVTVESPVSSRDRAVSYVLAATYNSFCGQPTETVRRYLDQALREWPDVTSLLAAFDTLLTRAGPVWADPSFEVLAAEPNIARIFERLAQSRPDSSRLWTLQENVAELLADEFPTGTDVLEPIEPIELVEVGDSFLGLGRVPNYTPGRCYLQANTIHTQMPCYLPRPTGGTVRITHRIRHAAPGSAATLYANGHELCRLPTTSRWTTTQCAVPETVLRRGVNRMEVRWPIPERAADTQVAADGDALARGDFPYVLPVFGEIFSALLIPSRGGVMREHTRG